MQAQPHNDDATGTATGGVLIGARGNPQTASKAIVPSVSRQVNGHADMAVIVAGALDVPPPVHNDATTVAVATITGGFISATDLLKKQFSPVAWAVDGILPEGAFILGGRPKMGKSWLSLSIALAVATGGKALGRAAVQAGDVLVLALEDSERRLQERLRLLLAGDASADVSRLTMRTDCPRLDKGGTLVVQSWLESHPGARLVVVDTLAKVKPRRRSGGDA